MATTYKLIGEAVYQQNTGATTSRLDGGAVTANAFLMGSAIYGNVLKVSSAGYGLYLFYTTDTLGTSFTPCQEWGSNRYTPLTAAQDESYSYVNQSYTDSDGVYHYKGYVLYSGYKQWQWDFIVTTANEVTIVAPEGCDIAFSPTYGEALTVPAGTTATATIYGESTTATLTAILTDSTYTLDQWTIDGAQEASTNPATLTVTAGDTISANVSRNVTIKVTIVAPAETAIDYTIGYNGEQRGSDRIAAGSSYATTITTDGRPVTVVLEAVSFDRDTFGGWTKDGVVVDAYSNPVTLALYESVILSCTIGSTSTTSGDILCDRYGNILYADALQAATTATIGIEASFEESGHVAHWSITPHGGEAKSGEEEITTTFSTTQTLTLPARGTNSGAPLYADKKVTESPHLVDITFHCEEPEHEYTLKITSGSTTLYSQSNLSATFSKTLEI